MCGLSGGALKKTKNVCFRGDSNRTTEYHKTQNWNSDGL